MTTHRFTWNPDCSGRGVCKLCGIKMAVKPIGPKGGAIQVYRVKGAWVDVAPKCAPKKP